MPPPVFVDFIRILILKIRGSLECDLYNEGVIIVG